MADSLSPGPGWTDRRLVDGCLKGDERAWGVLVEKYKNLVYSVVLRYGVASEEASDVFQTVWLDAYNDLPKLRKKESFKSWLISLTTHKCYHWKQQRIRHDYHEAGSLTDEDAKQPTIAPDFIEDVERQQLVREAMAALSPRCREMVRLLFFTFPPKPYKEVAEILGLATGSIGFIRGRCLQRMQKALEKAGIR